MHPVCLHDPAEIETFLRRNVYLNIYSIGDLDPFFWPYTTWYAFKPGETVEQLFLVYTGTDLPIILATADGPVEPARALLAAAAPFLPRRFYAHFTPGLEAVFAGEYRMESYGRHYKMALKDPGCLQQIETSQVVRFTPADLDDLLSFYQASYPGNWFDPRMLETRCYFGIRDGKTILSVAGIHVYSPAYRVAALGNITTHSDHRGRGLGTAVTARLCQALLGKVDHIGLNVKADNAAAIHTYEKIGFERIAEYEEMMLEAR